VCPMATHLSPGLRHDLDVKVPARKLADFDHADTFSRSRLGRSLDTAPSQRRLPAHLGGKCSSTYLSSDGYRVPTEPAPAPRSLASADTSHQANLRHCASVPSYVRLHRHRSLTSTPHDDRLLQRHNRNLGESSSARSAGPTGGGSSGEFLISLPSLHTFVSKPAKAD
jgi:hypothetical protein